MIDILIVDDHMLFREGLAAIIRREPGIEVVGMAGSVQEAVVMTDELKPDIVLMDFNLPDGTGVEATRTIHARHPEMIIVFLTMYEEDENLVEAVRSGAKGYLLKNMNPVKLVASLHSVCRGEAALSREMTYRLMDAFTQTPARAPRADAYYQLTSRERDILAEVATGATNRQISQRLFLAENTVKHHLQSIMEKLGVSNRKEAAAFFRENVN
jgi:DNA-binding NarL/FixJ family response regulator